MEFRTSHMHTNKTRELIGESEREILSKKERETDQTAITDLNGGGLKLEMVTTV